VARLIDRSRYINELNRDQGLGFLLLRKKITFTLVVGLLIQTVSAMIVVNTTLMSLLKVGDDEEACVNMTGLKAVMDV
jgi:hypothetical protein